MVRKKLDVLKEYLRFINDEKGLGYSEEEIEKKVADDAERVVVEKLLLEDLYEVEEHKGQVVSSLRSFKIFCSVVVFKDVRSGRRVWNSFVRKLFLLVERNRQTCLMAHRGSGKSFFFALYIVFKMFLVDHFDVCYSTNTPKQKKRWFRTFKDLVSENEYLCEKKDDKGIARKTTMWGVDELEYNKGYLEGTTVGTTPKGGHYNLVIGDDVLRDDKKYTNEYIVDYFQGILKPTTYTKKARYVVGGTPIDSEDLFHTLMNDKLDNNNRPIGRVKAGVVSAAGFMSEIFPAILSHKDKKVLLPEVWTYEELMMERKRIGDIRFAREMMCKCTSYRNSLVSASLFRSCCDSGLQMLQKGESGKKYVIFVDSATSDAPTADYCAMTVFEDNEKEGRFILRHLFHEKGYPITDPDGGGRDQAHKLYNLWNSFNKATVVVEKNNAGVALVQATLALGVPEIIEHYTHNVSTGRATRGRGKADDVVDYLEHGLKAGVVVFPSDPDDIYTISCLEKVKTEHLNFGVKNVRGGEKYEALSGHDDVFDSCWGAFKYRGEVVETLPMALTMNGGVGV